MDQATAGVIYTNSNVVKLRLAMLNAWREQLPPTCMDDKIEPSTLSSLFVALTHRNGAPRTEPFGVETASLLRVASSKL